MEETQETQETQDAIIIGNEAYMVSSLDEDSKLLLNDIMLIEGEIKKHNLQLSIFSYARDSVMKQLDERKETFELAPAEQQPKPTE